MTQPRDHLTVEDLPDLGYDVPAAVLLPPVSCPVHRWQARILVSATTAMGGQVPYIAHRCPLCVVDGFDSGPVWHAEAVWDGECWRTDDLRGRLDREAAEQRAQLKDATDLEQHLW